MADLHKQLEATIKQALWDTATGDRSHPVRGKALTDAILPLVSAGLAAARADEREKIAQAIEARLTHFTAAISDPYYDRAFREAAAVARSAGVEPKEQQP